MRCQCQVDSTNEMRFMSGAEDNSNMILDDYHMVI